LLSTCNDDQYNSVLDGTALIHDYIVIDKITAGLFPGLGNGNGTSGGGASGTASAPSSSATKSEGAVVNLNLSGFLLILASSVLMGCYV
jgi:hypothetical protein